MIYKQQRLAVPVGSAELNQGPTVPPRGRQSLSGWGGARQTMTTQSKPKPKPQLKKQQQQQQQQSLPCKLQPTTDKNQLNNLLQQELKNVNWEVIGFSEMRRPGEAVVELPNNNILYNSGGVAFLIHEKLRSNIEGFKAISDRVASVVIRISKRYKIKLIQVYAPTSVSPQELDNFYGDLYTATQNSKNKAHFTIIMGDFNAKVGSGDEECLGKFGHGDRNERGEDLVNFATAHGYKIINTLFNKKKNRRCTWRCLNYETFN